MLLRAIIDIIESVAPRSAQETWDNSGIQVGDTGRDISSVLLTTDVTPAVVNEALMLGCQLIISHHPLLFHGLKQICGQSPQAQVVAAAVKNDIAVYSAHTSLDSVWGGINTRLAEMIGLRDYRILVPAGQTVDGQPAGLGVIGTLEKPMEYHTFLQFVRNTLGAAYVRYTDLPTPHTRSVRSIALCGGSGAEFIEQAVEQGADVYITADCKYHEFLDADGRIAIVDIDHWTSEKHCRDIFRDLLEPHGLNCYISQADRTPVHLLTL